MRSPDGVWCADHRFDADGLIEEERLSPEDFFTAHTAYGDEGLFALPLPGPDCEQQLDHHHFPSTSAYLEKQARLWLGNTLGAAPEGDVNNDPWRLELGRRLGTLPAVHNLVRQAADTCSVEELLERFSPQLGLGDQYSRRYRVLVLDSLLALIAHARRRTPKLDGSAVVAPRLNLRQQLWLRELKRMVASVEETPLLKHSDDLSGNDSSAHLPVVHCRECGATVSLEQLQDLLIQHWQQQLPNPVNFAATFLQGMPEFNHEAVNNSVREYVREQAHTNGLASFWSILKRGYYGIYHKMLPKHLGKYVAEFASRHNIRGQDTIDKMSN